MYVMLLNTPWRIASPYREILHFSHACFYVNLFVNLWRKVATLLKGIICFSYNEGVRSVHLNEMKPACFESFYIAPFIKGPCFLFRFYGL